MEEEACCSKDVASTSDSCSFSAGASTLSDGRDSDIDSEEGKDQERRRVVSLLDRLKAPSVYSHLLRLQSEFFHSLRHLLENNRTCPYKITLKHLLCFNITRDDLLTKALMY